MTVSHPAVALAISDIEVGSTIQDSTSVAKWVRATARQHGIAFMAGSVDIFANAVSRLSDLDVQIDEIEQLLLALARRGVITGQQCSALRMAYLRGGPRGNANGRKRPPQFEQSMDQ